MKYFVLAALVAFGASAAFANESERSIKLRCEFEGSGKGASSCYARVEICKHEKNGSGTMNERDRCEQELKVICNGGLIYDDGLALGKFHRKIVLQGITSSKWPTPPAIYLELEDHDISMENERDRKRFEALLVTSLGSLEGYCALDKDHDRRD